MRGVMTDPSQMKKREIHSGPPCPHYPYKFRTEAAHQGRLASRRRSHRRLMKSSLDYRLSALLRTIEQRCYDPRHATYRWYGAKNIKNFLTLDMLKFMWRRDHADKMKKPSIDRADSDGDYKLTNCMFRELRANQQRGWTDKKARTKAIRDGMQSHRLIATAKGM